MLLLVGAMLAIGMPPSLVAQGTLPEWGRPLTPAQGRELNAVIVRLSVRLGVHQSTLAAIARVLGASLHDIDFSELVELVQAQAERAAQLQVQVETLQAQIASLNDVILRTPAEQALARAVAAFSEGRLDDADREFAALESLRSAESETARLAWSSAVDARARLAELRLDYDTAELVRVSAARDEQHAARLSVERQWLLMFEAARSRYNQGDIRGDRAALERAVALFRSEVLPLAPRSERPAHWALTQNELGGALAALGEREAGTGRLREAIAAYEASLQERTRSRDPIEWAKTMSNLGSALFRLGGREGRRRPLRQAANAYQAALEVFTRQNYPEEWARNQGFLASTMAVLETINGGTAGLEQAVSLYRSALEELSMDRAPYSWALAQNNLGATLRQLGIRREDAARLQEAVSTYEMVVLGWPRDRYPLRWAAAQYNLGLALQALGERETGIARLELAVVAFDAALQESTRDRATPTWAVLTAEKADIIATICERTRDCARLREAEGELTEAQTFLRSGGHVPELSRVNHVLRRVRAVQRRLAS